MATTGFHYALTATFGPRARECFSDPIRRLHFVWRWAEGYVASVGMIGLTLAVVAVRQAYGYPALPRLAWHEIGWWAFLFGVVPQAGPWTEFRLYEFLLEPWSKARVRRGLRSLVGPYFERGPQDGEVYIHP